MFGHKKCQYCSVHKDNIIHHLVLSCSCLGLNIPRQREKQKRERERERGVCWLSCQLISQSSDIDDVSFCVVSSQLTGNYYPLLINPRYYKTADCFFYSLGCSQGGDVIIGPHVEVLGVVSLPRTIITRFLWLYWS